LHTRPDRVIRGGMARNLLMECLIEKLGFIDGSKAALCNSWSIHHFALSVLIGGETFPFERLRHFISAP
jgi:hypothetical protein